MTRAYAISMFVLMTGAPALAQPQPLAGKAILKNADGKVVGTVNVYPTIREAARHREPDGVPRRRPVFHSGGTAIVIHANPDDNKTDPAGNAGARIASGVVEKP